MVRRISAAPAAATHDLAEKIYAPALADEVIAGLKELVPFYRYFAALCAEVYREE